ncbi:MAG: sugar phosphate isomerase/epimerase family protein [Phycisphaeraceae bacterium JB051]
MKQKKIHLGVGANLHAHSHHLERDQMQAIVLKEAAAMAQEGFDDMELCIAHFEPWMQTFSESYWQELGQMIRDVGIEPISVHGPYYPDMQTDPSQAKDMLIRHAKAASALGSQAMVIHPVYHQHLHVTPIMKQALTWDIELSLAISDALGDSPTKLAIENVPFNNFAYLAELFANLDRPNIGMCFDTGHYHVRPEHNLTQILKTFGKRIVHVHLSDNNGLSDQHLPVGQGTFDWQQWFTLLPMDLLNQHLMMELSPPLLCQSDDAYQQTRSLNAQALTGIRHLLAKQ